MAAIAVIEKAPVVLAYEVCGSFEVLSDSTFTLSASVLEVS